jgi:glyoxylase-like metal-dependent hydrolase (beta-lactamase superfamily II)
MFLTNKIGFITLTGLCVLALGACMVLRPAGTISVKDLSKLALDSNHKLSYENESIELTAFITGWVKAPANILIEQGTLNIKQELQEDQWVPSIAYVVRHPSKGVVILDTGLKSGKCDYGLRPVYWVPCRNAKGSDIVSRLIQANIHAKDIRYIIPSHFHGDHISGLENLLAFADAPVLISAEAFVELQSPMRITKGIPSSMLAFDMRVALFDTHWQLDEQLEESFDVFGDGTLKIFKTVGHTGGHISALLHMPQQQVLLTFDAAHIEANALLGIPSGTVASREHALKSLAKINRLSSIYPKLITVYGHEPSQWLCSRRADKLNVLGGKCF